MSFPKDQWCDVPLKRVATLNPEVLSESTPDDYVIAYVDIGSVTLEQGIKTVEEMPFSEAPSRARRRVRHGGTIVSTVRTYLRAIAPIISPPENLIVSTGFAVVRPLSGVNPRFLSYALRSNSFVEAVVAESVGVSYPAIAPSKLGALPIRVAPEDRQSSIADFLDTETAKIDRICGSIAGEDWKATVDTRVVGGLMGMLIRRRAALITAAVTGQQDVAAEIAAEAAA